MSSLDTLTQSVAARETLDGAVETLLDGLAALVKATSNDQNVQRLAREIKFAAPGLVEAMNRHAHDGHQ